MNGFFILDAIEYGLHEAVILQKITWWILENRRKGLSETHFHNDLWWMYTSKAELQRDSCPYFSEKTIRTTLESLINSGILLKDNFHKNPLNRSQWYAVTKPVGHLRVSENGNPQHFFKSREVQQFGLHSAVMLNYFRLVCTRDKRAELESAYFVENRWWTANSYADLVKTHPYFSEQQIRRANVPLIEAGLLIVRTEGTTNRKNWYSYNEEGLSKPANAPVENGEDMPVETGQSNCRNQQMHLSEPANRLVENGQCNTYNTSQTIKVCNISLQEDVGIFAENSENSTTEPVFSEIPVKNEEEEKENFSAAKEKEPPVIEPEPEIIIPEDMGNDLPPPAPFSEKDQKRAEALCEMFYRVAPWLKGDRLNVEINKFLNKYPYVALNKCGAIINTWVAKMDKEPPPNQNNQNANGQQQFKSSRQRQGEIVDTLLSEAYAHAEQGIGDNEAALASPIFGPAFQRSAARRSDIKREGDNE
jgi:hypothetical protein